MKKLMIPFVIKAYIANDTYADTFKAPRWSPDYTKIYGSALGSSITPSAFTEYNHCLKAGVHLHFILPDAFKHGLVKDNDYIFPTVPNRYVVTRLYEKDRKIKVICFVVESDFLKLRLESGERIEDYTAIPYLDNSESPYRFMGRSYEAGRKMPSGEYLPTLTALGAGDPMFAAYYPTCRSVFGWHDSLEGVPDECNLTYFVVGYFGNKSDDLFSSVQSVEDFEAVLSENSFTADIDDKFCDGCLLFGEAVNIEWKGIKYSYSDMNPPTGDIDVTFGATSVEAMSAILKQKVLPHAVDNDDLEYHLTQLQYDLLKQKEQIDANFKIDDEIHKRTFREIDPLEEYDALKMKDKNNAGKLTDLTKYYELRSLQREFGRLKREISFTRKKLYRAWETYIQRKEAYDSDFSIAYDEINALLSTLSSKNGLLAQYTQLDQQITTKREEVNASLPSEYELQTQSASSFVITKEPVLMVSGDGIISSFVFKEDSADNLLYCQISTQSSPEINLENVLKVCEGLPSEFSSFDYQPLLYQAVLNSMALKKIFGNFNVVGKISSLAVNTSPLLLSQLFMDWQVDYYYTDDRATLGDWKFEYGDTNYTFNGINKGNYTSVSGRIPLTPQALYTLADQLNKYKNDFPGIYDKVRDLPFISQELSGFTGELSGLRQVFQLPVTYDTRAISAEVEKYVEPERLSVFNSEFFPMRGGYIALSKLNVIGTFGQKQTLVKNGIYNKSKAYFPYYMPVSESGSLGLFPLAFSSEVRLTAEFTSLLSSLQAGEKNDCSPIAAIILPELLNNRLILYNEDGNYVGMLKTVFRGGESHNLFIESPEMTRLNSVLKKFIEGITKNNRSLLELINLIQETLNKTIRTCESDFIWGIPLVLAQLRVRFEFFGGAEYSKKRENFGKYDDKGSESLKIPLKFGNNARVSDGTVGVFEEDDFSKIHALWGVNEVPSNGYVTTQSPSVSAKEGDKIFTALLVPNSDLHIETGLLPVVKARIDPLYTSLADKIIPSVEINPIIANTEKIHIPVTEGFKWRYKTTPQIETTTDISALEETIAKNSVIDGFLVKKRKVSNK